MSRFVQSSGLKLATVGCGFFSHFHHQAWERLRDQYPLERVGVCDIDVEKAQAFRRQYQIDAYFHSFENMLERTRPDLVDLIVPPSEHLAYIELASSFGCDIVCQKPFTESIEQAERAMAIAEQENIQIIVHENFRFQPWYRRIKRYLTEHDSGEIYQIRFAFRPGDGQGPEAYLDRQPYFRKMPQLLIKETGVHFIDLFRFLAGDVHRVWADLSRRNTAIVGEDSGMFVFKHDNNVQSVFDGNRLSDHQAANRRLTMGEMTVETEKMVIFLTGNGEIQVRQHGSNQTRQLEAHWDTTLFGGDCVYLLQKHVLNHYFGHKTIENTAEDYLENLRIQSAIYSSASSGQWQILH